MKHLLLLSFLLFSIKVYPQADQAGKLKLKLETATDSTQKVKLLCNLSRFYSPNSLKDALLYADKAIDLSQKINFQNGLAQALNTKGVAYDYSGNFKKATEYYYKALKIWEVTRDSTGLSSVYNNIGSMYNVQGNFDKATEFYKKSLNIALAINDPASIAKSYNNLGNIRQQKGELREALEYTKKSLELKLKSGDKESIMLSLNNVGYINSELGEWQKAIKYHQQALEMDHTNTNTLNKAYSLYGLAQAYMYGKKPQQALPFALRNFTVVKAINSKEEIMLAADQLNQIYKQLGDYKKAYENLALYSQYKDSVQSAEASTKIAELQLKYTSEKAEKENELLKAESQLQKEVIQSKNSIQYFTIVLLLMAVVLSGVFFIGRQRLHKMNEMLVQKNRDVSEHSLALTQKQKELEQHTTLLKEQKEELQKLNGVKDRLFSIIAHDLRGPLVSLKGLLHVLAKGAVPEDKMQSFFKTLETSQQNSLWLLDNLLYWAKAQMSGLQITPTEVNIFKVANQNLQLLEPQAEQKNIKLVCQIEPDLQLLADKEMTDIVIRNLISNAIKFCKAGDQVTIKSTVKGTSAVISIEDTGIGILPEKLSSLFAGTTSSSRGTANEKGSGLGLQLCKYFIEKNNGKIWAESIAGEGSTFSFSLPIVNPESVIPTTEVLEKSEEVYC